MLANFQILQRKISFDLHGFSGIAPEGKLPDTAFHLMNRMWQVVKSNNLKDNGLNVWGYDPGIQIFVGTELFEKSDPALGLQEKWVVLKKCAFCRHVGPYKLIPQIGQLMRRELKNRGLEVGFPYVEVYGHWTQDEATLETDLYLALK